MPAGPSKAAAPAGADFTSALREQLEKVSEMQAEANAGVERLLTGESENITEVFSTARKAEVAFTLLMEIRNKLVDAYSELRQVRV
ncbi:MAG: flagellar hook-basal body complex protein FliE [Phycisphaerae bacterium]|nr:flagellar hook-basal body complex protein FliE [Phycisphaerae bacterium]